MPFWGWFLAGLVAGAVTYVASGNGMRFIRSRSRRSRQPDAYVAERGRRRIVYFKREEEAEDDVVGPVVVVDLDDPGFIYEFGWMRRGDAAELALLLGHPFEEV